MHSVTDHSTTRWTKSGPKTRLARQARGQSWRRLTACSWSLTEGDLDIGHPQEEAPKLTPSFETDRNTLEGGGGKFLGRKAFFPSLFHILKSHVYPSFWLKFLEQPLSLKKRERVIMERDGNWFRWTILVLGLCVVSFFFTIVSSIPLSFFFWAELKDILSMHATKHKNFQATHPNLIVLG